jgi:ADP-heptose:LPS heptosyltransferase
MEKGNANLHFLDRYLGIPLIVFLGVFRLLKREIPAHFQPKRIAILNISSIGDNVLMTAPVQDLRNRFPNTEIWVFCGDTNFGVVKMFPWVDKVIKLPVTKVLDTVKEIRRQPSFDVLIDFGPWPRLNAFYSFVFKARHKIGFRSIGQWRHFVYDHPVLHTDQRHELENFRALLSPFSIEAKAEPYLPVTVGVDIPKPYLLFHPWPGGFKSYMKEWQMTNWVKLAEMLKPMGLDIFVTGAKADVEVSETLVRLSNGSLKNIAGKYNLSETATLLQGANLLVSVNTGVMHMGAALGTPLVALHGPTSVKRWGPVSDRAINVSPQGNDCGYLHFGYEYHKGKSNCMEQITVEEVFRAVQNQLNKHVS